MRWRRSTSIPHPLRPYGSFFYFFQLSVQTPTLVRNRISITVQLGAHLAVCPNFRRTGKVVPDPSLSNSTAPQLPRLISMSQMSTASDIAVQETIGIKIPLFKLTCWDCLQANGNSAAERFSEFSRQLFFACCSACCFSCMPSSMALAMALSAFSKSLSISAFRRSYASNAGLSCSAYTLPLSALNASASAVVQLPKSGLQGSAGSPLLAARVLAARARSDRLSTIRLHKSDWMVSFLHSATVCSMDCSSCARTASSVWCCCCILFARPAFHSAVSSGLQLPKSGLQGSAKPFSGQLAKHAPNNTAASTV